MPTQPGVIGALSVWLALLGGVLLATGDAIGPVVLDRVGAVLLIGGVISFSVTSVQRSHREGEGLPTALARSGKDALRLAWCVFESA